MGDWEDEHPWVHFMTRFAFSFFGGVTTKRVDGRIRSRFLIVIFFAFGCFRTIDRHKYEAACCCCCFVFLFFSTPLEVYSLVARTAVAHCITCSKLFAKSYCLL